MAHHHRNRSLGGSSSSTSGGGPCLICCKSVELGRKPLKIPPEFGRKPVDVFLKICELLQVSFLEIQQDWSFNDQGDTLEGLPFCPFCVNGFHAVIKLQQQLTDIKRRIEEKITGIRDKIRESASSCQLTEQKALTFRNKALGSATVNDPVSTSTTLLTATTATTTSFEVPFNTFSTSTPTPSSSGTSGLWYPQPTYQQTQLPVTPQNQFTSYLNPHTIQIHTGSYVTSPETKPELHPPPPPPSDSDFNQSYYSDDGGPTAADDNYSAPDSSSESEEEPQRPVQTKRSPGKKGQGQRTVDASSILATLFPAAPRKRDSGSNRNVSSFKRDRQPEYFAPMVTDSLGRMTYEGIVLTPLPNSGYQCGQCQAKVGKDHGSISLRKAKIHIKGFHMNAYRCHLCDKPFTSNDILNQHLFRFHERGEVPCPTCGRPVQERNMKLHQISHMNAAEKAAAEAAGFIKPKSHREPTLPCRICGKLFNKPSKLKRHEVIHVASKFRRDYPCPHCPKAFTTVQGQKEHILCEHDQSNARKQLCNICGESIPWRKYKKHLNLHKDLTCKFCEKSFSDEKNYESHMKKCGQHYKRREDYKYQCDICSKYFPTRKYVNSHRRQVHKKHWKLKVPVQLSKDISVDNPREENLDDLNNEGIQHVEGNTWSYQLYEVEKLEDGNWKCCTCQVIIEGDDEDEDKVKEHVRWSHVGDFRCNLCSKKMKNLDLALAHKLEHEGAKEERWDCKVCGKMQIVKDKMKIHLWQHYGLEELMEAVNDGQIFPKQFEERDWRGLGNEGEIECGLCGEKGFENVGGLWEHRRLKHPEEKVKRLESVGGKKRGRKPVHHFPEGGPYTCQFCGKEFKERNYAVKHLATVHGKRGGTRRKMGKRKRREVDSEEEEELEQIKMEVMSEEEMEQKEKCEVCGMKVTINKVKRHVWSHYGREDVIEAINRGEDIPNGWVQRDWEETGEGIVCSVCGQEDFSGVRGLWQHRREMHKELTGKRVSRMRNPKTRGRKRKYDYQYEIGEEGKVSCPKCGNEYKNLEGMRKHLYKVHMEEIAGDGEGLRKRRNVKVICEEDEVETALLREQGLWGEVQVKQEVFPVDEEEDQEDEGGWNSGGDWKEDEENQRGGQRRSLRDRSSLKRREDIWKQLELDSEDEEEEEEYQEDSNSSEEEENEDESEEEITGW